MTRDVVVLRPGVPREYHERDDNTQRVDWVFNVIVDGQAGVFDGAFLSDGPGGMNGEAYAAAWVQRVLAEFDEAEINGICSAGGGGGGGIGSATTAGSGSPGGRLVDPHKHDDIPKMKTANGT